MIGKMDCVKCMQEKITVMSSGFPPGPASIPAANALIEKGERNWEENGN